MVRSKQVFCLPPVSGSKESLRLVRSNTYGFGISVCTCSANQHFKFCTKLSPKPTRTRMSGVGNTSWTTLGLGLLEENFHFPIVCTATQFTVTPAIQKRFSPGYTTHNGFPYTYTYKEANREQVHTTVQQKQRET